MIKKNSSILGSDTVNKNLLDKMSKLKKPEFLIFDISIDKTRDAGHFLATTGFGLFICHIYMGSGNLNGK